MTTQRDGRFLVTLLPSTDVELGRWMLQHYGIAYEERPHAPVFHALALFWHGFGRDDYPLWIEPQAKLGTIDAFLDWFETRAPEDRRLLPASGPLRDDALQLQRQARLDMGEGVVRWAYGTLLPHRDLTWDSFTHGVPGFERFCVRFGYGLIRALMTRALELTPEHVQQGLTRAEQGFARIEALLEDGRPYLCGERLTVADLAFAATAAPMVLAPGYGGHLPELEAVPEAMRNTVEQLRERPAGAFALRIYAEHREAKPGPSA